VSEDPNIVGLRRDEQQPHTAQRNQRLGTVTGGEIPRLHGFIVEESGVRDSEPILSWLHGPRERRLMRGGPFSV
jgi:hypothetical protein